MKPLSFAFVDEVTAASARSAPQPRRPAPPKETRKAKPAPKIAAPAAKPAPAPQLQVRSAAKWSAEVGESCDRQVVKWAPYLLPNAFLRVLGGSGSGKTVLLRSIYLQAASAVAVVALDFHGDLTASGAQSYAIGTGHTVNPLALASFDKLEGGPVRQAEVLVSAAKRAVKALGHQQLHTLRLAIAAAYKAAGVLQERPETWTRTAPTMSTVVALVEKQAKEKATAKSAGGLLAALGNTFARAFRPELAQVPLAKLLQTGARLELQKIGREEQVVVAETVLLQIFEALRVRGPAESMRVLLILDEASIVAGSEVLDTILREGRKFGLGAVIAAQQTTDFSKAVAANAAATVVMATNTATEARKFAREVGATVQQIQALPTPGGAFFRTRETVQLRVVPVLRVSQ